MGTTASRCRSTFPILFGATVISVMLAAWAALGPSSISNESSSVAPPVSPSLVHSVAYTLPLGASDGVYVRPLDASGPGQLVASFPSRFGLHARGSASPRGDRLAIVSTTAVGSTYARLTLLQLPTGAAPLPPEAVKREAPGTIDYLSTISWSRDGATVVATRTATPDATGRSSVAILEFDAASLASTTLATFENVYGAAPVGFSIDGQALFVVVTDQSGSNLWAVRSGRTQKLAALSPGRTRDWSLSPDGSRLAYVDILGSGERAYAGKTLVIATGSVIDSNLSMNELGPAWQPGSQVPDFGGPGGNVQLAQVSSNGPAPYVVPASWSPDGSTLAATVYSAVNGGAGTITTATIELVTAGHRVALSTANGAQVLGWVQDVN